MRKTLRLLSLTLLASLPLAAQQNTRGSAGTRPALAKPSLVVLISVDQLASDYMARWGRELTGGLGRLRKEGAWYARARHDHAIAETAPGHATMLSGRHPVSTGISSNSQGVNDFAVPLLGAADTGATPARFKGTTLLDWMLAADPQTRSLSVSRKDRGAILPIGRTKTHVYWYATNGTFTTSRYYADTLPSWVQRFNARGIPALYAGRRWTLSQDARHYQEPDTVLFESKGENTTFPHLAPSDPVQLAKEFKEWPWMDDETVGLALEGVRSLGIGDSKTRTDLLVVSLSTTDAVGHRYGPDSREIHDQIHQVDRAIGVLLDSLIAWRGKDGLVVALTSDHGVGPMPEQKSAYYHNDAAQRVNVLRAWELSRRAMIAAGVDSNAAYYDDAWTVRDRAAFDRVGVHPDSFAMIFVRQLRQTNGVERAVLLSSLAKVDTTRDHIARRWLHMFPAEGPARAVVSLKPFTYFHSTDYYTHGTPYDYDTLVPLIFWGSGIIPGERTGARVVDLAPTLAARLGIKPLEPLDGSPLRVIRGR